MLKQMQFKITKGMSQDLSKLVASPNTAFKLVNIKNQILDKESGEALVNEKGTELIQWISDSNLYKEINGLIIGVIACSPEVAVVFVKEDNTDTPNSVYKFYMDNNKVYRKLLAQGKFGFGDKVSGIFCYENSELQKVYWIDEVNLLRYINIADSNKKLPIRDSIYMDSSPEFNIDHTIEVKRLSGGGNFTAGVIQYAFTYFMKYGAETGIVDTTPLYYISELDRGSAPDAHVGISFKVTIHNPDTRYDYIRLYSILRGSINGEALVKIVKDIKLK